MNSIVARKRILLCSETEELALCCLPLPKQGQWSYIYMYVYTHIYMYIYVDGKISSRTLDFSVPCPINTATGARRGCRQDGYVSLYSRFWTLQPQKAPNPHFGTGTMSRKRSKFQVTKKYIPYHGLTRFPTNPYQLFQ